MKIKKVTYEYHIETHIGPDRNGKGSIMVDTGLSRAEIKQQIYNKLFKSMADFDTVGVEIVEEKLIEVTE